MAPRKFKKAKLEVQVPPVPVTPPQTSVSTSLSAETAGESAASRVYGIGEIRARICALLQDHDLTKMMRVGRPCMADAVRLLYRNVSYRKYRNLLKGPDPGRRQIYLSAIVRVDARGSLNLSASMRKALDFDTLFPAGDDSRMQSWLATYNAEVFNLVVPDLRRNCPHLRKILFGHVIPGPGTTSWTVYCESRRAPGTHLQSPTIFDTDDTRGHVEFRRAFFYPIDRLPPSKVPFAHKPPSVGYTTRTVESLRLTKGTRAGKHAEWLAALRNSDGFTNLYHILDVLDLPAKLSDLTHIIQRQVKNVANLGFATVYASHLQAWSLSDFHAFACIASTSLQVLQLVRTCEYNEDRVGIAFSELPDLFSVIRDTLPNLHYLQIAVKGIETAEVFCQDLLSSECLEGRGNLTAINILTARCPTPLFNVLRYLATYGTSKAKVVVTRLGSPGWEREAQQEYLEYLRSQPSYRRSFLALVDFPSLEIYNPSSLSDLAYDFSGRPTRRAPVIAGQWVALARGLANKAEMTILPELQLAMADLKAESSRFATFCETSTSAKEMRREARRVRSAARSVMVAARHVEDITRPIEHDVGIFLDSMRPVGGIGSSGDSASTDSSGNGSSSDESSNDDSSDDSDGSSDDDSSTDSDAGNGNTSAGDESSDDSSDDSTPGGLASGDESSDEISA